MSNIFCIGGVVCQPDMTYRYVYGNHRLSVDIAGINNGAGNLIENGNHVRLYYHTDYLGTTDYLTSPVSKKVTSWTHYNEWGEITHNAVLKMGVRELDLVKNYTGHEYDSVLDQFYAKYRMYDASDRRFTTIDPIRDGLNWYAYVENNPIMWVDPLGLYYIYLQDDGTYLITPESYDLNLLQAMVKQAPFIGDGLSALFQMGEQSLAIGGNSYQSSEEILINWGVGTGQDLIEDKVQDLILKPAEKIVEGIGGGVSAVVMTYKFIQDGKEMLETPAMDAIVFKMFEYAGLPTEYPNVESAVSAVAAAYNYLAEKSWYFWDNAYTVHPMAVQTLAAYGLDNVSHTMFSINSTLYNMKKQGKSDGQIEKKMRTYHQILSCFGVTKNSNFFPVELVPLPGAPWVIEERVNPIFYDYVYNYEVILESFIQEFKSVVQAANPTDSSVPSTVPPIVKPKDKPIAPLPPIHRDAPIILPQ